MIRCFLLGFEHLYTKQNLCFLRSADELLRNQETCDLLHFSGFLEHKLKERWLSCGSAGRPRERDGCKGQLDSQMSIWTRRFSYNTQLSWPEAAEQPFHSSVHRARARGKHVASKKARPMSDGSAGFASRCAWMLDVRQPQDWCLPPFGLFAANKWATTWAWTVRSNRLPFPVWSPPIRTINHPSTCLVGPWWSPRGHITAIARDVYTQPPRRFLCKRPRHCTWCVRPVTAHMYLWDSEADFRGHVRR